jgi:archaellum biogenesis ATPase FlaH
MATHPSYRTAQHKAAVRSWLDLFPGTWITAFHDKDKTQPPKAGFQFDSAKFEAQYETMCQWSGAGYGIFFTPNRYDGGRKKTNCKGVNAWFADQDAKNGSCAEHIERIAAAKLKPKIVVQSSPEGHHSYWFAQNGTIGKFDEIENGLVHALGADANCKDLTRVMRLPHFLHQKRDPIMPRIIEGMSYFISDTKPAGYTDDEMLKAFPKPKKDDQRKPAEDVVVTSSRMNFWNAAASINNKTALKALSGKAEVRSEVYDFKPNANGTEQIWVNGESTSSWIDLDGHIGSHDKGGPTYIQWLKWYGLSLPVIAVAIKKYLREFLPAYDDETMAKSFSFIPWNELVDRAYQRKITIDPNTIPKYHFKVLDDTLGGILPTDLITVGADTGNGKSELLLHVAIKNAERGKKVLYYQLEMDEEEIADRPMLAAMNRELAPGWISRKNYRINEMKPKEREAFAFAREDVRQMGGGENIVVYQGGSLNAEEFLESLQITKQQSFDLIVLDHLHYFTMDGSSDNMTSGIGNLMRKLRTIVKTLRIPVIVASHVRKRNKEGEGPSIMDLYGSGDIAKESSVVLLLHRDDADRTSLRIAKSRGTGHRDCELSLYYDKNLGCFTDMPSGKTPKDDGEGKGSVSSSIFGHAQ